MLAELKFMRYVFIQIDPNVEASSPLCMNAKNAPCSETALQCLVNFILRSIQSTMIRLLLLDSVFFRVTLRLILWCITPCVNGKLNLIYVTPGQDLPSNGEIPIAPTYSVAVEDMAQRYPDIYRNYSLLPVNLTNEQENLCAYTTNGLGLDKFIDVYGGDIMRKREPTVILSSRKCHLQ